MKKTIVLVAAIMLFAAQVLARSDMTDSFMPGACPLAFSPQYEPEIDFSPLPGRRPTLFGLVFGGVAGNLAGAIGLGFAGSLVRYSGEGLISPGTIVGVPAGSVFGSALGVCLAGNTRYWRGRFGSALLGSSLGIAAALVIDFAAGDDSPTLILLTLAVLPPVGSALLFSSTLDRRFSRTQGGLFGFSRGKLRMGVPDLEVRPVSVPDIDVKPGLQFNVTVFSVEL